MAVLPGVLGCSFDRLRTGGPCDVPFRYASEPTPCGCPARGASACAARGTPIFVVSRQQCIKYPGSLIGSQKSLGLHGNLVEIESGQVLFPEKQLAS
ncbi:MAG: hypothetical protein OES18_23055 [Deltaproteobacteria bacterium]|nr:hypothetical protein [Deltaproteobacteria bacterium]